MLIKIKSIKSLPYKTYISTLIPNDADLSKYDDMEGYLIVTKSPKMTIIFIEYKDGGYNKTSKEIWDHV